MLSKDICIKCINSTRKFKNEDVLRWRFGYVYCPIEIARGKSSITDLNKGTPEYCPYALEHLMKDQENVE